MQGRPQRRAGGDAGQHPFPAGQLAARRVGVGFGNGDDLVIDRGIQHFGHEARADALQAVGPCLAAFQHRGAGGFHRHHLHGGGLLFQVAAHAGDGAAGTGPGHEDIHPAVGILPDLGAGGSPVGRRVGGVHELPGKEAAGGPGCQLLGLGDGPGHAFAALGEHQFRAVGLHQLAALDAHGLGHDDDDPVAAHGRHHAQADAGVAGSGFDDDRPGLEAAVGFGLVQHGPGYAVLDRTAGVEGFQLGQHPGLQALGGFDAGEFQQRGMPDQLLGGYIDLAHGMFPPLADAGRFSSGGPACII